ncbi:GNAT family N-acetyltransferase [Flavobacterium sp. SUN046]|uniref:GNAT family N-acetyltransferase n=1 Tax=Flavobacterium sp. SUN046 TaxID=3002440 RepID=UPI002DB660E2|nr:GNAT family N-acetyltransferase [Flavobacterium sp. SUN046]MEC4047972.1 GNAT family N-acetyltransferase [Flavobacterium sp. SUN046]
MSTQRLKIEQIQEYDFTDLLKIYQQKENMKYILSGKYDYKMLEIKEKWNLIKYNPDTQLGFNIIKLKSDNRIIGECGLLATSKSIEEEVEIAYMIDKKFWGQGLGTEICKHLVKEAFENIKTKRIIAGMYKENINSIMLITKMGFNLCNEGLSNSGIYFKEFELLIHH